MREWIQYRLEAQRTSLVVVIVAITVGVLGMLLVLCTGTPYVQALGEGWSALIDAFGTVLVTSVTLLLIWELAVRRIFLSEVLSKVGIASQLRKANILKVVYDSTQIEWADLFSTAREVDLFFMYGKSWRGQHEITLRELVKRSGSVLRVVLPDPSNAQLMHQLAISMDRDPGAVEDRINEAIADFESLRISAEENGSTVTLHLTNEYPIFSYYRFDHVVIMALYTMSHEKRQVPHLVLARGGSLFEFADSEFNVLLES